MNDMLQAQQKIKARRTGLTILAVILLAYLIPPGIFYWGWGTALANIANSIWNRECPLKSSDHFFRAIRDADRLVVRNGGFDCCASVDNDPILFTVTNAAELQDIQKHIEFVPFTNALFSGCMCCGFPGLDWYKGNKRVALTSIPHGTDIRWQQFGTSYKGLCRDYGDVPLTTNSSTWVCEWLLRHNITNDFYWTYGEGRIQLMNRRMSNLAAALDKFRADTGSYPSAGQGLQVLIVNRDDLQGWKGPYLKIRPVDPWGSPFRYVLQESGYEIRSAGPDCKFETGDDFQRLMPGSQKSIIVDVTQ